MPFQSSEVTQGTREETRLALPERLYKSPKYSLQELNEIVLPVVGTDAEIARTLFIAAAISRAYRLLGKGPDLSFHFSNRSHEAQISTDLSSW